ncbi:ATP-binding protein [Metabacillus sp. RGM 3146]|uniref:ATP-binding protein n=1 Tax=Metabacillus sp. RGM 3146 TaxID=3401092 RepID=UPI003B9A1074
MLGEKLLLHVLIVLAPVLIQCFVFENRRIGQSQYFIGFLYGGASVLCMIFSYRDYSINWDLRFVPLVLAVLYGGKKAGVIALLVMFAARTWIGTWLGGSGLVYGYACLFVIAFLPFFYSKGFLAIQVKNKRILTAIAIGFWPFLIQIFTIICYFLSIGKLNTLTEVVFVEYLCLFGSLQIIGTGAGARLIEGSIEKNQMRMEIIRSERLNTIGEMAASIAHEIRNPLTVVKGFLQLMKGNGKDGSYEYLPLVLSEIDRAESIINDYLNFSKPKIEKMEKFQIGQLLKDICQLLEPYAVKKGVILEKDLVNGSPIETDRNQLSQAFINLVKNAIEATDEGGKVLVQLQTEGQQIVVSITDTGKGMSPDQVSKIGTLYYTTKEKGTGLGTAISLKIIETMHGRVRYESALGVGTVVTVNLPLYAS